MRLIANLAFGATLMFLAGCESVTGPMPLNMASPPPAPVQASSVRIELRNLTATTSNSGPFFYSVKFVLANTDDVDGAEIQGVTVEADGGFQDYVIGCPPIRIYLAAV